MIDAERLSQLTAEQPESLWDSAVSKGFTTSEDILSALAALVAVALANYDPARFLAADHYGGFVVGIVVVLTGLRVLRDASLELADRRTCPGSTRVPRRA